MRKTPAQTATASNTVSTAPIIAAFPKLCFLAGHWTASRRWLFSPPTDDVAQKD
jgi:hypothetical protein